MATFEHRLRVERRKRPRERDYERPALNPEEQSAESDRTIQDATCVTTTDRVTRSQISA